MRRWVVCAVLTVLFHVQRPGKDPGQVWAAPVLLPRQCVLFGVGCDLARVPQTSPHTSTSLHLGGHPASTFQVTTQEKTRAKRYTMFLCEIELETSVCEDFTITEKATTLAFSFAFN